MKVRCPHRLMGLEGLRRTWAWRTLVYETLLFQRIKGVSRIDSSKEMKVIIKYNSFSMYLVLVTGITQTLVG